MMKMMTVRLAVLSVPRRHCLHWNYELHLGLAFQHRAMLTIELYQSTSIAADTWIHQHVPHKHMHVHDYMVDIHGDQ